MKILFFASIAEYTGTDSITLEPVRNTDELQDVLIRKFPQLNTFSYAIAVNKAIIRDNAVLVESDEVALLPPFSGG
jgi:molybdopterin synthase sulfur carrier subunit